MKVIDIKEGKTFYHVRITRAGNIYELNKVNINTIRGNIECIFQIIYTTLDPEFISYTCLYERRYVEESNSSYFIKVSGEEYLTLPNKQALMKAVRAQMMTTYAPNMRLYPKLSCNYKESMKRIKQLH
jgi:hypothetical protein